MNRDAWEGNLIEPLTLNSYVYGVGNPINFTDPSGYISESEKFYIRYVYDWFIKDGVDRLNVRSVTNLSNNAFAAMIAARILVEDATIFADQRLKGIERQLSTLPPTILRDWLRDLVEQYPPYDGEISWGPGNIPLPLALQNLEWWEQHHSDLGLNFEELQTSFYDARDGNWLERWLFGTEQSQIIIELQTNRGAMQGVALAILQSSHRARQYWASKTCEAPHELSAYIITMGVTQFRASDVTLYELSEWNSKGSQWDWTEAIDDAADVLGLPLSVPKDYIPYTEEEKQKLDTLPPG